MMYLKYKCPQCEAETRSAIDSPNYPEIKKVLIDCEVCGTAFILQIEFPSPIVYISLISTPVKQL